MNKYSKFLLVGAIVAVVLILSVSVVNAQGGGYTPENVVKSITTDGFIFESYNRSNGQPYSGGQRVSIRLNNGNPYNVCRTNGNGENGTLLGAFVFEGQPFAVMHHPRRGLYLASPTPDQLATEPRRGRTPICEVSRIAGDANDEDFTSSVGQFVVTQTAPGGRFSLSLNGEQISRTNNSGNGDALRLLIFQDDGLTIPVILAANGWSSFGITLHTTRNLVRNGTDIELDRRIARNLEVFLPEYAQDLIPDDGSRS